MDPPEVSDEVPPELPQIPERLGAVRRLNEKKAGRAVSVLPRSTTSKPVSGAAKSPWERVDKSAHLQPVQKLPDITPAPTRQVETVIQESRVWHSPVVLTLIGFLATFAAYVFITDGFSTDDPPAKPTDTEVLTAKPEQAAVAKATPPVAVSNQQKKKDVEPEEPPQRKAVNQPDLAEATLGDKPLRGVGSGAADVGLAQGEEPRALTLPFLPTRHIEKSIIRNRRPLATTPALAWLTLKSKPSGVDVLLDGQRVGSTPMELPLKRDAAVRKLTFEKDGVTRQKTVTADKDQTVMVRLVKPTTRPRNSGGSGYDLY